MTNRRSFLQKISMASAAAIAASTIQPAWSRNLQSVLKNNELVPPSELASDEDFWEFVQKSYNVPPDFINLNNAGVSPAPRSVSDAMKANYDISNQAPSYFMWRIIDRGREPIRKRLAGLAGCDAEEIALH